MVRELALVMLFSAAVAATAARADARRDCEHLSGDAAIQACDQTIRQFPRDRASYYNRAIEFSKKGDLDRAIADYTKAIEIDPKEAAPYNNRAVPYTAKRALPPPTAY